MMTDLNPTKKMIIDDSYLSNTAISQSRLKRILKHPKDFIEYATSEFDEPKDSIIIGDGVDMLITQGEDAFFENFFIMTEEKPSGQMGDFVWNLYAYRNNADAETIAYESAGFKRDSIEKVRDRFAKEGSSYYNALVNSENKQVISPQQHKLIYEIKESLMNHKFTKDYFENKERYDVHFQIPLNFTYKDIACKALLDMIVVDKIEKTLYPIDIKTSYVKTHYWYSNLWKFRYDIQAAFYTEGLIQNNYKEKYGVEKMNNFRFMVESQTSPGNPMIYEVSNEILEIGKSGGKYGVRNFEGFDQAIDRYKWHTENNLWEYSRDDYQNNGIRFLTLPDGDDE